MPPVGAGVALLPVFPPQALTAVPPVLPRELACRRSSLLPTSSLSLGRVSEVSHGPDRRTGQTLYDHTVRGAGFAHPGTCCPTAPKEVARACPADHQPRASTGGVADVED